MLDRFALRELRGLVFQLKRNDEIQIEMITIRHGTTRVVRAAIVVTAICAASPGVYAGHTASLGIGVGTASPVNTESAVTLPRGRWAAGIRTEYTNYTDFSDAELLIGC